MKNQIAIVSAATLIGLVLRLHFLNYPLWIDEAWIAFQVKNFALVQEYPFILIAKVLGLSGEGLRWISVISGTLTIPAIYWVIPDKTKAMYACFIVAVFPVFAFWSGLARPYALAGLLIVLGWRYLWVWFVAVAVTPIAVVTGFPLTKNRLWVIPVALLIALGLFLLRQDAHRDFFNWQFISNSSRLFYLPCLVLILYTFTWEEK